MLISTIAMFTEADPTFAAEYLLKARDFEGELVTGDPKDHLNGFTWCSCWYDYWQEVEDYNETGVLFTGVNKDIFPEVFIFASVAMDQYRVWIYQMDESGDRSLEVSIDNDQPTKVGFDYNEWGSYWKWLDLGIHEISENTVIKVKAVGGFTNHGQPYNQRRGGFMAILLTTDTTDQYPAIDMEKNRCGLQIDNDSDSDGIFDTSDNCPEISNPQQEDYDSDNIGDACDDDDDSDGVLDINDACNETMIGAFVDENGCSGRQNIDMACPCDINPAWKNHGQYVSCVSNTAEEQLDLGLINQAEKSEIVSEQAKSDCGKKK
jgi:hypothetical protein